MFTLLAKIFWSIAGLLIVATLVVAGWFWYSILQEPEGVAEQETEEVNEGTRKVAGGNLSEEEIAELEEKGLNPFGEAKEQEDLTDANYQEYIHGMSHQKVKASEKWGFYKITDKRIDWLIDGLKETDLTHKDIYAAILEKWNKGDFSTADDDHNAIWKLQGGTIGYATGVLNPEEEKEYLD